MVHGICAGGLCLAVTSPFLTGGIKPRWSVFNVFCRDEAFLSVQFSFPPLFVCFFGCRYVVGESERDGSDGINSREGENEVDNGKTLPQLESCSLVSPEGGGGGSMA